MFKLPNQKYSKITKGRFFNSKEEAAPGTPLFRKDLDKGIQGEANDDGSIFLSNSIEPGSKEEEEILTHEMKHLTDMKLGRLKYTDDDITWDGEKHVRSQGYILYNGEWVLEGSKEFPWEKH
jgi:hypothetical protein